MAGAQLAVLKTARTRRVHRGIETLRIKCMRVQVPHAALKPIDVSPRFKPEDLYV